jgi:hypothetical protein
MRAFNFRFVFLASQEGSTRHSTFQWSQAATVIVLGSVLSACAAAPAAPVAGPDPSSPDVRVPSISYRSTIGSYQRQRPVEPGPWIEQNQRVTPQPKQ